MNALRNWFRSLSSAHRSPVPRPRLNRSASFTLHSARLRVEALEERNLLTSFTPIEIRHAYGFDRVGFENSTHALVTGNGAGQTIGIVDAFDDPNIANDLATFDATYGIAAPPSFTKVNQTGGTDYPPPNAGPAPGTQPGRRPRPRARRAADGGRPQAPSCHIARRVILPTPVLWEKPGIGRFLTSWPFL
jgi:hypothetical protein